MTRTERSQGATPATVFTLSVAFAALGLVSCCILAVSCRSGITGSTDDSDLRLRRVRFCAYNVRKLERHFPEPLTLQHVLYEMHDLFCNICKLILNLSNLNDLNCNGPFYINIYLVEQDRLREAAKSKLTDAARTTIDTQSPLEQRIAGKMYEMRMGGATDAEMVQTANAMRAKASKLPPASRNITL